jgi:hypothetical protein
MANLPIFGAPMYQTDLIDSCQTDVSPTADGGQGPLEFNIIGNNDFIDLNAITLHIIVKIVKQDGNAYEKDAEVAFINNAFHSLFSDVIVSINETTVEGGEHIYYLKSLINTLFAYSDSTMEKQLFSVGFVKDEAGKVDEVANKAHVVRKGWTNDGASKEFYGKLFVDMFQQTKYLVGNVNMRIKMIRAANSMALWTNIVGEKPKIVIQYAKLYVRKIKPHPQIVDDVISTLSRGGHIHYPIHRTDIVMLPVAPGVLDITKEQLFYGRIPKILVMCMIDSEALNGVYGKSPFKFEHFNIKHVELRMDGDVRPLLALTPNFASKLCLREYNSLLENMNILGKDAYLPITYEEYMNGYTFFAWNLTADYLGQPQNPGRRSNIRLDLKFVKATPSTFNIVLYCIFDSIVMIDASGIVQTDYKD